MAVNFEALATDIIDWLKEKNLNNSLTLFVDDKAFDCNQDNWVQHMDPEDYVEYFNKEGITITFNGPFYNVINDAEERGALEEFKNILAKYNTYFISGFKWSLSVYRNILEGNSL
ncbi:hypothetical protein [Bacillus toyonensis]|uniref:hypothetical protein n=1 Tax=Bacillus toyonensis TaxID=155322 RepID=UPI002E24AF36|nr:hypothetical protein [Bacillus toyonensis]